MFELVERLNQVNGQIFRKLSPIVKSNGITIAELIILWKINKKGPYRITDIAKEAGLPASTITGVIDRFELRNYIDRVQDTNDRRSVLIQGTEKLDYMITASIESADKELEALLDEIEPGFMERFLKDLEFLQNYLGKKEVEVK